MNKKICRNSFFSFGIITFLMLFIIACDSSDGDSPAPIVITGLTGISTIDTDSACVVACSGNYVYTVDSNAGVNSFQITDMSDPAAPAIKGSYNVGNGYGLALNGNYAYIETDIGGDDIFASGTLGVMDITNPTNPVPVMGNSAGYVTAYQTYYHNGYVYNASDDIIGIYSVNDPAALVHETNISTDDIYWLALSGNYMYSIDYGKLRIWDITDPTDPAEIGTGTSHVDLEFGGIATKGDYVFAMGDKSNVLVFDVSEKSNPDLVIDFTLTGGTSNDQLYEARILGNYLLIAGGHDFYVVNIANPAEPEEIDSVTMINGGGWGFDVLNNRYAIVADDTVYRVIQLW